MGTRREHFIEEKQPLEVVVVDIKMRFGSMVVFLVKLTFAAIPAVIVIAGICAIVAAVITGMVGHK
jgi:hypothetical protein